MISPQISYLRQTPRNTRTCSQQPIPELTTVLSNQYYSCSPTALCCQPGVTLQSRVVAKALSMSVYEPEFRPQNPRKLGRCGSLPTIPQHRKQAGSWQSKLAEQVSTMGEMAPTSV